VARCVGESRARIQQKTMVAVCRQSAAGCSTTSLPKRHVAIEGDIRCSLDFSPITT